MRQVQFPFPDPPEGYAWEEFEYSFDSTNTPALATQLATGQSLLNIPLALQSDAPFLWRGIQVYFPQQFLGLRFRDAFGRFLSDDFVPSSAYSSFQSLNGSLPGIGIVLVEPGLECPKGSVILLDLANIG